MARLDNSQTSQPESKGHSSNAEIGLGASPVSLVPVLDPNGTDEYSILLWDIYIDGEWIG